MVKRVRGKDGFPGGSVVMNSLATAGHAGDPCLIPGWEDPLEEMATQSSILAWRISWTEDPGGLQSMRLQSCIKLSD